MLGLVTSAIAGLLAVVAALISWSAKRELGLADARFVSCTEDMAKLEERLRQTELNQARLEAKSDAGFARVDELISEMHELRSLMQQVLARLPKRAGDAPGGV